MFQPTPGPSSAPDFVNEHADSDDELDDPIQQQMMGNCSDDSDFDSDDADIGTQTPAWNITTSGMRPIEFVKQNTLLVPIPGNGRPLDFFSMLLDSDVLQKICDFTNENALNVFFKPSLTPKSRIHAWKSLQIDELKVFLGLLLHTGTIRLNRIQDYWRKEYLFGLKCFSTFMSRDRFLSIFRCLHFSNSNDESSPIQKIKFMVDYFNQKMLDTYYPQKELSLDEAMVLWRGRLHFKQYIQGKRHKYGVKLYTLTEHQGIILKFLIYAGAGDKEVGGQGHTEKVVMHLMREKLGVGHSVYMDNFYNSFTLAAKLLANKTYCTGTLRSDRKHIPLVIKNARLKRGETICRYGDSVMVAKWRDKRDVTYISTEHENEMVDFLDKRGNLLKKPLPIIKYNAHMSGVDRADQMLSYYPCERKTLRWYKKIFVHIVQMLLLNSHALYNMHNPKMTFYDFRLEVLRGLLPEPKKTVESPLQKRARKEAHKIVKTTERDNRNRLRRKNCRSCWKKTGKEYRTVYYCETCPDNPGLCMGECFETYHDNL